MGAGDKELTRGDLLESMGVLQALGDTDLYGILDFNWLPGPAINIKDRPRHRLEVQIKPTARPPQQFRRGEDRHHRMQSDSRQEKCVMFQYGDPVQASQTIKTLLDAYVNAYEAAGWDNAALRGCDAYRGSKYVDPFSAPTGILHHDPPPVRLSALGN